MQTIVISTSGGPEVLQAAERPIPELQPGHVLVRVAAAGINRIDILQRRGKYPPHAGAPQDIPGMEVSGTVEAVHETCLRYRPGDKVMALLTGDGYAEYVAAPEDLCLPIPANIAVRDAAALPEAMFTVWANLFVAACLRPSETVLIHGGASGIGSMAIQMLRAHGAHPIVTARSEQKCKWCVELGAELAVNYQASDFAAAIKDYTQGRGVDVILDMIGGDYLPRNISLLAPRGRLVWIGAQRGVKGEADITRIMQQRLVITGSSLRGRTVAEKSRLAREIERRAMPWLVKKAIKPVIYKVFPLNMAAEAHKTLESGEHHGKILLEVAV